jgi:hypothetical protein
MEASEELIGVKIVKSCVPSKIVCDDKDECENDERGATNKSYAILDSERLRC